MAEAKPTLNADELETFAGFEKQQVEGKVWEGDLGSGLSEAFDYRGDVTLRLNDGSAIEGYIFDHRPGECVRIIPKDGRGKVTVPYAKIEGLAFTGRDTAAGKSWEAWVQKYKQKRAQGQTAISLEPESLD